MEVIAWTGLSGCCELAENSFLTEIAFNGFQNDHYEGGLYQNTYYFINKNKPLHFS